MAKKKNLKGIDQLELEFINEKLSKVSSADYLGEDNMVSVNAIKALNYKLNIKCKNEKQKNS